MKAIKQKRHIYRDCYVFEYADGSFVATALDIDGDPMEKKCKSLDRAKKWIDHVYDTNAGELERLAR